MTKRFTLEEAKQIFENEGYTLLNEEYIDSRQPLDTLCPCGHSWQTKMTNFQRGSRCEECKNKEKLEEIRQIFAKEGYTLITDTDLSSRELYEVVCPHGHTWKVTIGNFKTGRRCKYCKYEKAGSSQRLSYEYIKQEIEKEGYKLLSTCYNNAHELLSIQCTEGHVFSIQWANWQQGYRCPICNEERSYGEKTIERYLVDNNILYEREKQFKDCKDKQVLPFDFYLPDYNLCIEYDGEQHFKEVKWFGGKEGFEKRVKHDNMKNKYCEDNSINLLRIPYTEFENIENILKQAIN